MLRPRALKLILFIALFLAASGCAHVSPEKTPLEGPQRNDPYLNALLARDAENRGDWQQALTLYETIDDPFAWLAQARIYFILNQSGNALELADRIMEDGSYADDALELRTKIYARKGDWEQAIADTETLAEKYPDNQQLLLFLANLKIVVSDFQGARDILEGLLGSPDDSMTLYTLAKACLGAKDFDCAKTSLREVIETNPKFTPAYLDLGKIYGLLGQNSQAQAVFEQLLEIDPYSNDGLIALSELKISRKQYAEAISLLERLMKVNPHVQILRKIVMLKIQVGLLDEALEDLGQIEEKTDEDSYYLAITYARLNRLDDALQVLEGIPADGRLGCDVAVLKSTILKESGKAPEALEVLLSAWDIYAETDVCPEVGYQLATELDSAGRREEGLDVATRLLDKNPRDPVALNFIGYVWADEGIKLDEAYDMIREALDQRPEDPFILDSMAWVLYRKDRAQEALGYLRKALKHLNNDPTIHEHMGDILKSLGRDDEALDYYIKSSVLNNKREEIQDKIDELLE